MERNRFNELTPILFAAPSLSVFRLSRYFFPPRSKEGDARGDLSYIGPRLNWVLDCGYPFITI